MILNSETLKKLIKLAGEKLSGEWILLGGTLLPSLGVNERVTLDIDLVPSHAKNNEDHLKLMELAEFLKLPVESVNPAGEYFLKKIPDYEKHLLLLHQGSSATVFRPDLELYLRLKVPRLSESDLSDCLAYLKYTKKNKEDFSPNKMITYLKKELSKCENTTKKERIETLIRHFST